MCDPVSAGMFAVQAAGQIGEHQAQKAGVKSRNRARLRQFDYENQDYLNEVKLNNAVWKNDTAAAEVEEEQVFQAMVDQWNVQDQQLDEMFADYDYKLQDAIIQMYEDDYAGTQTGATAARRVGKGAKEKGFKMSKATNDLILAKEKGDLVKEAYFTDAETKMNALWEKVRFPPQHGHTPVPPELEAKPSTASLVLNLATSAAMAYGFSKMTNAKGTGMKETKTGTGIGPRAETIGSSSRLPPRDLLGSVGGEIGTGTVGPDGTFIFDKAPTGAKDVLGADIYPGVA